MRSSISDRSLHLGVALALTVVGSIAIGSYQITTRLLETTKLTTHTHEVLNAIEAARSAVRDVEDSQRGYIITGEEDFLGAFSHGDAAVRQGIGKLRWLTRDNPRQQRRLDGLAVSVVQWLSVASQAIDARK